MRHTYIIIVFDCNVSSLYFLGNIVTGTEVVTVGTLDHISCIKLSPASSVLPLGVSLPRWIILLICTLLETHWCSVLKVILHSGIIFVTSAVVLPKITILPASSLRKHLGIDCWHRAIGTKFIVMMLRSVLITLALALALLLRPIPSVVTILVLFILMILLILISIILILIILHRLLSMRPIIAAILCLTKVIVHSV